MTFICIWLDESEGVSRLTALADMRISTTEQSALNVCKGSRTDYSNPAHRQTFCAVEKGA